MTLRNATMLLASVLCAACGQAHEPGSGDESAEAPDRRAVRVEIVEDEGGYRLLRAGEPYEVRGAGVDGGGLEALAAHGGNAVRTWSTESYAASGRHVLDVARDSVRRIDGG